MTLGAKARTHRLDEAEGVIEMKVGFHAGEDWNSIIERKRRVAVAALWGYVGSASHPTRQVCPFARECGSAPPVAMPPTGV